MSEASTAANPDMNRGTELAPRFYGVLDSVGQTTSEPYNSGDAEWAQALITDAWAAEATDIHVDPVASAGRVRFRMGGSLVPVAALDANDMSRLINQFRVLCEINPAESGFVEGHCELPLRLGPADDSDSLPAGLAAGRLLQLRCTFAPTSDGTALVARLLDTGRQLWQLQDLQLPAAAGDTIAAFLGGEVGLAVVAGPTGSGKTTTLFAMADALASESRSLVTIEEPVEIRHPSMTQIPIDLENGLSLGTAMVAALRMDPDYLMIGEARDAETANLAIQSATSGRLTMTSVHAEDAVGVVSTLRSWEINDPAIARMLRLVIAQRLIRLLCPDCRTEGPVEASDRDWLKSRGRGVPKRVPRAVGCSRCRGIGYHGRRAIFEVWQLDREAAEAIRRGDSVPELRDRCRENKQKTLLDDGWDLVAAGQTTIEELRNCRLRAV